MIVYGIVIALTIVLYIVLRYGMHYSGERSNKMTISFFFISYLLLLCLRDASVGVDTKNYILRFEILERMTWKEALSYSGAGNELGFMILNKLVGVFGGPRLLIIVSACMIVLPVLYLYKNEAEGAIYCMSFFLISLLFEMFFSGMRQSIAIALAVPAYYLSKKREIVPFILTVVFAFLFHRSGAVIAAIYPMYHAKITKKWLWVVVPAIAVLYYFRETVFEYLLAFAGRYREGYSYLTGSSGQRAMMVLFIMLSIYSYVILDEEQAGEDGIGLRNLLLLATCIHLFTPLHPMVSRISMYFILFIPVAITRINNRCKPQYMQLKSMAVFVMSTYFIVHFLFFGSDSLGIMNYKFFF